MTPQSIARAVASTALAFHQANGRYPRYLYLGRAEMDALRDAPDVEIPGMRLGDTTAYFVELGNHCTAVGMTQHRPGQWAAMPVW